MVLLGRYDRARDYIRLDAGSQWAISVESDLYMREGKPAEALALARNSIAPVIKPFVPCLEGRPLAENDSALVALEALVTRDRDSEPPYWTAGRAAYCGNGALATRLLRRAVEGNYLAAAAAMDRDPLLARIRNTPEFGRIRAVAIEKQKQLASRRGAR